MTYKTHTPIYSIAKEMTAFPKQKILSSQQAFDFIRQFYHDDIEIYESFYVLLLNAASNSIGYAKISQGGITGTIVDVRIIAKIAIDSLAVKIILAHNHPSGNLTPSEADRRLTERIKQGLQFLDINVMDHIILTVDAYYSFADEGML